jgi:hypothetical protein
VVVTIRQRRAIALIWDKSVPNKKAPPPFGKGAKESHASSSSSVDDGAMGKLQRRRSEVFDLGQSAATLFLMQLKSSLTKTQLC